MSLFLAEGHSKVTIVPAMHGGFAVYDKDPTEFSQYVLLFCGDGYDISKFLKQHVRLTRIVEGSGYGGDERYDDDTDQHG